MRGYPLTSTCALALTYTLHTHTGQPNLLGEFRSVGDLSENKVEDTGETILLITGPSSSHSRLQRLMVSPTSTTDFFSWLLEHKCLLIWLPSISQTLPASFS